MLELERTYLAKYIPADLTDHSYEEVLDVYFPSSATHPNLRLRKSGDNFEMTKKSPIEHGDASSQNEETITLTEEEFNELATLEGKRVRKLRYFYPYEGRIAEFDVFQDALEGLVLVDFEFTNEEDKEQFELPDFCLVDVTQESFIAGGMLCGKRYADIEETLGQYNYQKL